MPQRGAGGTCAALRRLRADRDRLQLLPQPALPEVPGAAPRAAGSKRARPICCRWTTTMWCSRCRRRSAPSPTTTRRVIYGLLFEVAAETLRTIAADPEASRRADRRDAGAAHLGLGADASSACARHRSRRRPVRRRRALGRLQAGLLPAGARALAPVPASLPRRTRHGASRRPAAVLR